MTHKMAIDCARFRARETNKPYVIYRVRNGQWMMGPLEWYQSYEHKKKCYMVQTIRPNEPEVGGSR